MTVIQLGIWATTLLVDDRVTQEVATQGAWSYLLAGGELPAVLSTDEGGSLRATGLKAIQFWNNLAVTFAWGFVYSYFWMAATAIYFLLRREVDGTPPDEVFLADGPLPFGLPPLATDAAGVAGVSGLESTPSHPPAPS